MKLLPDYFKNKSYEIKKFFRGSKNPINVEVCRSIRENIAIYNVVMRVKEEMKMCWRNFNTKFHVYTREFLHYPFMHVKQLAVRSQKNVAEILSAETEISPRYACNGDCNKHICNYSETCVELSTNRHGKWYLSFYSDCKSRIYSKMNIKYTRRKNNYHSTFSQFYDCDSEYFLNIFYIFCIIF